MPLLVGNLVLFENQPYLITEFVNSKAFYIQNYEQRILKRPRDVKQLQIKGPSNYTIQEQDFADFEKHHKLFEAYEKKLQIKIQRQAEKDQEVDESE